MSTANLTDKVRISCDTRWQPKSHKADPRYVGDLESKPKKLRGYWAEGSEEDDTDCLTMDKMKQIWGFA